MVKRLQILLPQIILCHCFKKFVKIIDHTFKVTPGRLIDHRPSAGSGYRICNTNRLVYPIAPCKSYSNNKNVESHGYCHCITLLTVTSKSVGTNKLHLDKYINEVSS